MSQAKLRRSPAPLFAALGDDTRLALLSRLGDRRRHSLTRLAAGSPLTRQAISKHLQVLEKAGVVHRTRAGRESLYELDPAPVEQLKLYLHQVSRQWDQALARLKAFVEQ